MSLEATLRTLIQLAAPVPALIVGALVMRQHGIGLALWGTNLVVGAAALLVLAALGARSSDDQRGASPIVFVLIGLGALAATFLDAGVMGVHRWVQLGPISIYAGAVALPMLIIAAGKLRLRSMDGTRWEMVLFVVTAAILVAQPDAAQASGLAVAAVMLTLAAPGSRRDTWIGSLLVIALAIWSWLRKDPLEPVAHVEGILGLAQQAGTPWLVASIVSLALLPLPFFIGGDGARTATIRALGVYMIAAILVPLVRNYPFPLLGYGVSPIIGYAIALSA